MKRIYLKASRIARLAGALVLVLIALAKAQPVSRLSQNTQETSAQQDTFRTTQDLVKYLMKERGNAGTKPSLRLAVPFEFDSAILSPSAKRQLDELGRALQLQVIANSHIELDGHTDKRGSKEYNQNLSSIRAKSAKNYLVTKLKIDSSLISAVGFGKSKLIVVGAFNEAEHATNRRVEMHLFDKKFHENSAGADTVQKRQSTKGRTETTIGTLGFAWGALHVRGEEEHELIHYDGSSTLRSYDQYRIFIHPNTTKYVYIYQVDSKGKGSWLFPRNDIAEKNPLPSRDYWFPSRDRTFVLDENTGTENIYLIVTDKPAPDLESFIKNDSTASSQLVTQNIRTRGVEKIQVGPAPANVIVNTVTISGASSNETGGLKTGVPEGELATIISQTSNFYVVLKFGHE